MKTNAFNLALLVICGFLLSACSWDGAPCERVHSELLKGAKAEALEKWVDNNIDGWEASKKVVPRYSFGAGQYLVPLEIDPASIGLQKDAEAQAVIDSKGKIVLIEIIDSQQNAVAVTATPGRWYSWSVDDLLPVGNRVAVVCVSRD